LMMTYEKENSDLRLRQYQIAKGKTMRRTDTSGNISQVIEHLF